MDLIKKLKLENLLKEKIIFGGSQRHMYHLVTQSPWPLLASIKALMLTIGGLMTFHWYKNRKKILILGLIIIIFMMYVWWRDIIREATYLGYYMQQGLTGLQMDMILFIVSEIMFFFLFSEHFFYSSLSSNIILKGIWLPIGILLLNIFILLILYYVIIDYINLKCNTRILKKNVSNIYILETKQRNKNVFYD